MIAKNAFSDRRRRFSLFLHFGNGVVALELFFVLLGLVKTAAVHFRAEAAVNTLAHHAGGKLRLDLCDLVLEKLPRLPRFSARAGAEALAADRDERLRVRLALVEHRGVLRPLRAVYAGAVGALRADEMLNADLVADDVDADPVAFKSRSYSAFVSSFSSAQ